MEIKKDIGSAFRGRLKEFKNSPSDDVWENIEAELKKKKDRKIIPFWYFFGGSALILLIAIMVFTNNSFTPKTNENNTIRETDSQLTNKNNINDSTILKVTIVQDSKSELFLEQKNSIVDSAKKNRKSNSNKSDNSVKQSSKQNINKNNHNNTIVNKLIGDNRVEPKYNLKSEVVSDSVLKITSTDKTLNENDTEKKDIERTKIKEDSILSLNNNKWSISANSVFTYFGSFNKTFNNQITINYGLYFTYLASENLSLRIGATKLNYQFTAKESDLLSVQQRISYLELPLEIKYTQSKGKIKISFIGGFSYLILQDASITSLIENNTITNKNDFNEASFSLNGGIGFQTRLYKNIFLNIEPMFKYNVELYSKKTDYKPFSISIIGGIEYKL